MVRKKLEIELPEKLKENTTYVLTIGAAAQDSKGNKLGQSKSFSFSTGKVIHNGVIFGRVIGGNFRSMNVWAYKLSFTDLDSFIYHIPDYITQTDSSGKFHFDYLSYGKYLILSVDDKNNDQFWTPPSEKLALPDKLIELSSDSSAVGPIFLTAAERDTLTPFFSKVFSPDIGKIRIEYSHKMNLKKVFNPDHYKVMSLSDSLSKITIDRIYPAFDNDKAIIIDCKGMIAENKFKIEARNIQSVYDMVAESLSQVFTASGNDSTGPQITQLIPKPTRTPLPSGFAIRIGFDEAIDTSHATDLISLADTVGTKTPFTAIWDYPNHLVIKPQFESGHVYRMTIDQKKLIDLIGNKSGDSVSTYDYFIAPEDTFGQISGQITNAPGNDMIVIAAPIKGDSMAIKCRADGAFSFPRLMPGVYWLSIFWDINGDSIYTAGMTKPFNFAEPVILYPDSVVVRSRWESDIGKIDFATPSE